MIADRRTYPVTATTNTNTLGTHAEREDLGGDNPRDGAPGVGKVDHKDPYKHDTGPTGRTVSHELALVRTNDTGNDEVANRHASSTRDQDLLTTDLVNPEYGRDGEEELHNANDSGCEQGGGVSGQIHILEDVGASRCQCCSEISWVGLTRSS